MGELAEAAEGLRDLPYEAMLRRLDGLLELNVFATLAGLSLAAATFVGTPVEELLGRISAAG